jgi:hypothetical protein
MTGIERGFSGAILLVWTPGGASPAPTKSGEMA